MKKNLLILLILLAISGVLGAFLYKDILQISPSGAPTSQVADDPPESVEFDWARDWVRPDSPPKVALQIGHLNNSEVPDELEGLRGNTGATGGGTTEVAVNTEIANLTADILRKKGIEVEILPATVPERYWADVFVAIHADGNLDKNISGFKAATPRRDFSQHADELLNFVKTEYAKSTNLPEDPNVTRNMRGYYAFGWWRYNHAVHPMTTSLILETGFLSSPNDRNVIVKNPELSAQGLSNGIILYLESRGFKLTT